MILHSLPESTEHIIERILILDVEELVNTEDLFISARSFGCVCEKFVYKFLGLIVFTIWMPNALYGQVEAVATNFCVKTVDKQRIFFKVYREFHNFKDGENLSELLFQKSEAGQRGFELYSRDKWLQRVILLNPKISSWTSIRTGTKILLEYPKRLKEDEFIPEIFKNHQSICYKSALKESEKVKKDLKLSHHEQVQRSMDHELLIMRERQDRQIREEMEKARKQQEVVANAEQHKIEDLTKLPDNAIRQIPKEVLAKKLTEENLVKIPEEDLKKIPHEVMQEKAQETSFLDSFQPGMEKMLDILPDDTASGYFGLRYGGSFAKAEDDALAAKVREIGVLAEVRKGSFKGTRLYFDHTLEAKADVGSIQSSINWQKISLGYAFEFQSPFGVDLFHLTPKLGRYNLDADLPVVINEAGDMGAHHYSVGKGLATGLEADMEFASLFYVLRGWGAKDFSGVGIKTTERVTSTRFGLDLFLKSSGMKIGSRTLSIAYLAFVSSESLQIQGSDDEIGSYDLKLSVPFAGLGIGFQW